MKIETKFNIGDTVYRIFSLEDQPKGGKIRSIIIYRDSILYDILDGGQRREETLFATEKECAEEILKQVKGNLGL